MKFKMAISKSHVHSENSSQNPIYRVENHNLHAGVSDCQGNISAPPGTALHPSMAFSHGTVSGHGEGSEDPNLCFLMRQHLGVSRGWEGMGRMC